MLYCLVYIETASPVYVVFFGLYRESISSLAYVVREVVLSTSHQKTLHATQNPQLLISAYDMAVVLGSVSAPDGGIYSIYTPTSQTLHRADNMFSFYCETPVLNQHTGAFIEPISELLSPDITGTVHLLYHFANYRVDDLIK